MRACVRACPLYRHSHRRCKRKYLPTRWRPTYAPEVGLDVTVMLSLLGAPPRPSVCTLNGPLLCVNSTLLRHIQHRSLNQTKNGGYWPSGIDVLGVSFNARFTPIPPLLPSLSFLLQLPCCLRVDTRKTLQSKLGVGKQKTGRSLTRLCSDSIQPLGASCVLQKTQKSGVPSARVLRLSGVPTQIFL